MATTTNQISIAFNFFQSEIPSFGAQQGWEYPERASFFGPSHRSQPDMRNGKYGTNETTKQPKEKTKTGWWLGHPSEKYERQLGWLANPIYGK